MASFKLDEKERAKLEEWYEKHKTECTWKLKQFGHNYFGASGGGTSFVFTPTSLGMCVQVQCACGAKKDITNCDDW
jgi:hypothetical protein